MIRCSVDKQIRQYLLKFGGSLPAIFGDAMTTWWGFGGYGHQPPYHDFQLDGGDMTDCDFDVGEVGSRRDKQDGRVLV